MFKNTYTRWPFGFIWSIYKVILALFNINKTQKTYGVNLAYYIDIAGNALTGGHPDVTVSARVGYYAKYYADILYDSKWEKLKYAFYKKFWQVCEKVINETFRPVDGSNHCYNAYLTTKNDITDYWGRPVSLQKGLFLPLLLLLPIVVVICLVLMPIIYLVGKTKD